MSKLIDRSWLHRILLFLGGTLLTCLLATPALATLSIEQINSIARQTTVLIAPRLTPELIQELEANRNNPEANPTVNPDKVWNPGSGVIIAKQGKTYYVLTVAHNFQKRFVDANMPYGIRTWDRQVHMVKQINDGRSCPLKESGVPAAVVRFGCRDEMGEVQGIDIAIVSFESDRDYAIATLGDATTLNLGDMVYISGWPDPEKEAISQRDGKPICGKAKIARRQRRLAWGDVTGKISPAPENLGYSIFYTDNTRAGMSGGPVFDRNGRVVGTHGMGSMRKPECGNIQFESRTELESKDNSSSTPREPNFISLLQEYSSSQNVNEFMNLIRQKGMNLPFNLNPPSADLIKKGISRGGIQAIAQASGKVEFDAQSDGFEDPNDVVEDIYQGFSTLEVRIKDCPNGLLLGPDECDSR
jgi:hypothetical protein